MKINVELTETVDQVKGRVKEILNLKKEEDITLQVDRSQNNNNVNNGNNNNNKIILESGHTIGEYGFANDEVPYFNVLPSNGLIVPFFSPFPLHLLPFFLSLFLPPFPSLSLFLSLSLIYLLLIINYS